MKLVTSVWVVGCMCANGSWSAEIEGFPSGNVEGSRSVRLAQVAALQ